MRSGTSKWPHDFETVFKSTRFQSDMKASTLKRFIRFLCFYYVMAAIYFVSWDLDTIIACNATSFIHYWHGEKSWGSEATPQNKIVTAKASTACTSIHHFDQWRFFSSRFARLFSRQTPIVFKKRHGYPVYTVLVTISFWNRCAGLRCGFPSSPRKRKTKLHRKLCG